MFQYENQIISNNLLPELLNALLISFISFIIIFISLFFQHILLHERYNKLLNYRISREDNFRNFLYRRTMKSLFY